MWSYDDWGGWYDHVRPPRVDRFGYGFRVPALLVSPYAKRGHIDSTTLDFTSMLKFIEYNWKVRPLATRDRRANNLTSAFDFTQPPRPAKLIPYERGAAAEAREPRRDLVYVSYGSAVGVGALLILLAVLLQARRGRGRPPGRGAGPPPVEPPPGRPAPRAVAAGQGVDVRPASRRRGRVALGLGAALLTLVIGETLRGRRGRRLSMPRRP